VAQGGEVDARSRDTGGTIMRLSLQDASAAPD
jgi:hypothetical protein